MPIRCDAAAEVPTAEAFDPHERHVGYLVTEGGERFEETGALLTARLGPSGGFARSGAMVSSSGQVLQVFSTQEGTYVSEDSRQR